MTALITKYLEKIVLTLLFLLSAAIAAGAYILFVAPLEKTGQVKIVFQICASLFGLLVMSVLYILYLHLFKIRSKARIQREFIFNREIGTYTYKKTGQLYCGSCLVENIESPLITSKYGWFCQRKGCSKTYSNPDTPRPPASESQRRVISPGIDSWWAKR